MIKPAAVDEKRKAPVRRVLVVANRDAVELGERYVKLLRSGEHISL